MGLDCYTCGKMRGQLVVRETVMFNWSLVDLLSLVWGLVSCSFSFWPQCDTFWIQNGAWLVALYVVVACGRGALIGLNSLSP